jgi:hypothetical protein
MQALLELLEQDAAVSLNDRLRQASGARGVQHPQRVIEWQLLEAKLGSLPSALEQLPPTDRVRPQRRRRGVLFQVGQHHRVLDGR